MTTKTWTGGQQGRGFNPKNPQNWSPTGVPQPGDYLQMVSGQMNISPGHGIAGAELHLGNGHNNVGPITLNLAGGAHVEATPASGGDFPFGLLGFGDPLTINNTSGVNHLSADNLSVVDGTVNIAAYSDLVVSGTMTFAYFDKLEGATAGPGTRGTITNNGTISVADGGISAHVNGQGTLELHQYHDGIGSQKISGTIESGQNVKLMPDQHGTFTELVQPGAFHGSLEYAPGPHSGDDSSNAKSVLQVDGIWNTWFDISGDMLRLHGAGGRVDWQVQEKMPAGGSISLNTTAAGTQLIFTPHPLVG